MWKLCNDYVIMYPLRKFLKAKNLSNHNRFRPCPCLTSQIQVFGCKLSCLLAVIADNYTYNHYYLCSLTKNLETLICKIFVPIQKHAVVFFFFPINCIRIKPFNCFFVLYFRAIDSPTILQSDPSYTSIPEWTIRRNLILIPTEQQFLVAWLQGI